MAATQPETYFFRIAVGTAQYEFFSAPGPLQGFGRDLVLSDRDPPTQRVQMSQSLVRVSDDSSPADPVRDCFGDTSLVPAYRTDYGSLFQEDCEAFLGALKDESVEMVFADPPFNLRKDYGPGITDAMKVEDYLEWSRRWLAECVRILEPGGTLFVFNLPRWLIDYGAFLNSLDMEFRHWIAMRMPKAYPRGPRMSPAHYGCLYYSKGAPKTFNKVYVPIETCRHCKGEIRDYGGHRKALNERGINMMDVFNAPDEVWEDAPTPLPPGIGWTDAEDLWADIPPVRHNRYKLRGANALAPIMLERLVAMSTNPGDVVVDPFGGTGTTYYAAEKLQRRWIGSELGDVNPAIKRLTDLRAGIEERWESARGTRLARNGRQAKPAGRTS